jgi:hypothetical protein
MACHRHVTKTAYAGGLIVTTPQLFTMQRFTPLPANNTRHENFSAPVRKVLATTAALWIDSSQSSKVPPAVLHRRPTATHKTFAGIGFLHPRKSSETSAVHLLA